MMQCVIGVMHGRQSFMILKKIINEHKLTESNKDFKLITSQTGT